MTVLRKLVPFPVLSLFILALWLALNGSITLGQVVLGAVMAAAIPPLTARFWPDRPILRRPLAGVRLFFVVLLDIVIASWIVARLVVGPIERLRSDFVEVPLDIKDPFVATILGSIVSLTPGTVSVEIDRERGVLLVHALDVDDAAALAGKIKSRYEAPLLETFAC
jgi:multicomponent K+:H+ antiporter subunit E